MEKIYLDWNATAPLRPGVVEAMLPYLVEDFGNPSSVHQLGRKARKALTESRELIALKLGLDVEGFFFTSSATESINTLLKGLFSYKGGPTSKEPIHYVTSSVEHPATIKVLESLKRLGARLTVLGVNSSGKIDLEELRRVLRPGETALASFILANNETGVLLPGKEIVEICHSKGVPVHFDCVQILGKSELDLGDLGADALSFSAHKVGGPKGVGALYMRRGFKIDPLLHGGSQERARRAGTENLAGIVGFSKAVSMVCEEELKQIRELKSYFEAGISKIPGARIIGREAPRIANTSLCLFEGVEGEAPLLALDLEGVYASSGSACSSGSLEPSHVLLALGETPERARSGLRLSIGWKTTREEIDRSLEILRRVVERVRGASH